jgi:Leucine-rich repeat (LRR) protein
MPMPESKTINKINNPFNKKNRNRNGESSPILPFSLLLSLLLLTFAAFSLCPAIQTAQAQEVVHFSDRQLEAAVRQTLDRPTGILSGADLSRLQTLNASRQDITDLSGLEYAVNLQNLNLYENNVQNLAPLEGLTRLQILDLAGNNIAGISSLQRLTALEELNLSHNNLGNIDALKNLSRLKTLRLEGNQIGTLAPLEPLRNLQSLALSGNITDKNAASLARLTRLEHLSMTGGQLSDGAFLSNLKQLKTLELEDNRIAKIDPLKGLSRLEQLSLAGNQIEDLTPLSGLRQLRQLDLSNNRIREITPLLRLRNIQWLELQNNFLELAEGKQARKDVDKLLETGTEVITNPQKLPLYRGNGLIVAAEGSGGKLLRTPIENYFTILNRNAGWRIKGFTVTHEGGKPLDRLGEVGLRTTGLRGTSSFAWQSINHDNSVGNKDTDFFTITYRQSGPVQIGLAMQIWPGYADDSERAFYISQVILENMETKDLYTIELERTPPLQSNQGSSQTDSALLDFQEQSSRNKAALRRALAGALEQRATTLEVRYSGETLQMPRELENMLEEILAEDDYLHYSQSSQKISWAKQPGGELLLDFRFNYLATREEENIVNSQVDRILKEIIKPEMDKHQKTRAIHDFIVANVAYDLSYREHSSYSALIKGRAICQGYALLMYKMLQGAGIEVRIISGRAGGEEHAWNLVRLDGNWYHIDATWDDPVPDTPGRILYDYYNRTDAQMAATHTWERGLYPAAQTAYPQERLPQ